MRILLVAPQPFYQERGTPIAVRMLVEVLCGQGHAVDLLTYHEGADLDIEGLRILRTPALPGLRHIPIGISWKKLVCDLLISGRLLGLALSHRYDVIHAVEEAVFPAILLRSSARARVVYDMDSLLGESLIAKWRLLRPAERALHAMERAVIRRADAVFAVCSDLAQQVSADAPGVPVFLIEDVALPSAKFCGGAEPLRELLGIRGALALYVGNLQRYQGIEQVVRWRSCRGRSISRWCSSAARKRTSRACAHWCASSICRSGCICSGRGRWRSSASFSYRPTFSSRPACAAATRP
jgi:hypothetical protein